MKRTVFLSIFILLTVVIVFGQNPAARASADDGLLNLDLNVFVAADPAYFILVEKDFQRLRVLKNNGRLEVVAEYRAATGENYGRKVKEGDEKTPEGVYFIIKRYTDSKMSVFGRRAFHLNYPNFFDDKEGRDGNGIYIHGTNRKLRFNSTNGCVTLDNTDLDKLAGFLKVGQTPVIIVSSLLSLEAGRGIYPDLTENDYARAKELLVPEELVEGALFKSLYMIRVNGQTVVGGEYITANDHGKPVFSAAYIEINQEAGWFVVERTPQDMGEATRMLAVNVPPESPDVNPDKVFPFDAVLPVDWYGQRHNGVGLYGSWYRDSLFQGFTLDVDSSSTVELERGDGDDRLVYGFFILAACLGLGSALVFMRYQGRRQKLGHEIGDWKDSQTREGGEQLDSLRRDIQLAKKTLRKLREEAQGETKGMDVQDMQARVEELENGLLDKQAEIEQLLSEKAALKLKGMSHLSGQVEELGVLQHELTETEAQLKEAQKDVDRLPILEEMIAGQRDEIQQLSLEKAAMKMSAAESADHLEELEHLRAQVLTLEEELQAEDAKDITAKLEASTTRITDLEDEVTALTEASANSSEIQQELMTLGDKLSSTKEELVSERHRNAELAVNLGKLADMEDDFTSSLAEIERLKAEVTALNEIADNGELVEELTELHDLQASLQEELVEERQKNAELADYIGKVSELEDSLASSRIEIERLHAERTSLLAAADRSELEEEMTGLRSQLAAVHDEVEVERTRNSEFTGQESRINELEELVLHRQVDVASLTNEVREMKEQALLDGEQRAALMLQISRLEADLREERARPLLVEGEQLEPDLVEVEVDSVVEEPVAVKVPDQEVRTESAATRHDATIDKTVVSKGSDYLPDDIMMQWINS